MPSTTAAKCCLGWGTDMTKTEQKIISNLIIYGQHTYCYDDARAGRVLARLIKLGVIGKINTGPGGTLITAMAYRSKILATETSTEGN